MKSDFSWRYVKNTNGVEATNRSIIWQKQLAILYNKKNLRINNPTYNQQFLVGFQKIYPLNNHLSQYHLQNCLVDKKTHQHTFVGNKDLYH